MCLDMAVFTSASFAVGFFNTIGSTALNIALENKGIR